MVLCVPPPVQFALVEGVVQLWNLEPVPKCRFPGDQVRAWKLAPKAWLAFRPQVAKYFSSVPVLCAVWISTHTTNSYLLLPHHWFFFSFCLAFLGGGKVLWRACGDSTLWQNISSVLHLHVGYWKIMCCCFSSWEEVTVLHNRDVFILNVTKSIFNGVTEQK